METNFGQIQIEVERDVAMKGRSYMVWVPDKHAREDGHTQEEFYSDLKKWIEERFRVGIT